MNNMPPELKDLYCCNEEYCKEIEREMESRKRRENIILYSVSFISFVFAICVLLYLILN